MTHRAPGVTSGDALVAEQAITLEQAIRAYTLNAAFANHVDDVSGSLQVGKSADLVVLHRDIFNIPATELGRTKG